MTRSIYSRPAFWFAVLILSFFLAAVAWGEDVRPDGTEAEAGTDCTTSTAHTATDNDTDDAWNESDDCIDDSCTASADTTFVSNITFASPSLNPTTGAGDQTMAVKSRECSSSQSGAASIRIDTYCGTTLVDTGSSQSIDGSSPSGVVLTEAWTFNTTDCAADGSDVEILVFCDAAGGSPSSRVGCDFDAIEWRATVAAPSTRSRAHVIGGN